MLISTNSSMSAITSNIKTDIGSLASQNSNIIASIIGYLNKLILKDKINVTLQIDKA